MSSAQNLKMRSYQKRRLWFGAISAVILLVVYINRIYKNPIGGFEKSSYPCGKFPEKKLIETGDEMDVMWQVLSLPRGKN